jgi:ribonuclease HII
VLRKTCFPTLEFEQYLWAHNCSRIAGIDEAGRGAWAGPVSAAAVILPPDQHISTLLAGVRDSKLMTPLSRAAWAPRIRSCCLAWGIGFSSPEEIDLLGILPATKLAALRAIGSMTHSPDYLLTDYLIFPEVELPQTALIKGDQLSLSISAASVLAKTARDALMDSLDEQYPGYHFSRHKGYGTSLHLQSIHKLGRSEIHRKSFIIKSL